METSIPVLFPSLLDMDNLISYVEKIEKLNAHKWGIVKIVPPCGWSPRPTDPWYQEFYVKNYEIPLPILTQSFEKTKHEGVFIVCADLDKVESATNFSEWVSKQSTSTLTTTEYWEQLVHLTPEYGADIPGSLFQEHVNKWNLGNLQNILTLAYRMNGQGGEGLIWPSVFVGSPGSTFGCHTEDFELYSINYLHHGIKTWYGIPPAYFGKLQSKLKEWFPEEFAKCPGAIRHKIPLIRPDILLKNGIPFGSVSKLQYSHNSINQFFYLIFL